MNVLKMLVSLFFSIFIFYNTAANADNQLIRQSESQIAEEINGLSTPDSLILVEQKNINVDSIENITIAMSPLGDQGKDTIVERSLGCSTGCSTGCSYGCSSGCSYGCR